MSHQKVYHNPIVKDFLPTTRAEIEGLVVEVLTLWCEPHSPKSKIMEEASFVMNTR